MSRVARAAVLLVAIVTVLFLLVELAPGDPADLYLDEHTTPAMQAALEEKYCLSCPAPARYLALLSRLAVLDFGVSIAPGTRDRPVTELIGEALPKTLLLVGLTLTWVYPAGVGLGTAQALKRGQKLDHALNVGTLTLYSIPEFVLALALVWGAPRALPISGWVDPVRHGEMGAFAALLDHALHLILPVTALGAALLGGVARYTRAAVLQVLDLDFVRMARAKGLPEREVITRHVLRNALVPIVVRLGLSLPLLVSGAVVVERVFALPGMGRLLVTACIDQDLPVLIGCTTLFCLCVVIGNLLADRAARALDPRIGAP